MKKLLRKVMLLFGLVVFLVIPVPMLLFPVLVEGVPGVCAPVPLMRALLWVNGMELKSSTKLDSWTFTLWQNAAENGFGIETEHGISCIDRAWSLPELRKVY